MVAVQSVGKLYKWHMVIVNKCKELFIIIKV